MAKTVVLDSLELARVVLMKDQSSGKVLVQAAYRVKSGNEVMKTTPDRLLTFAPDPDQKEQPADLLTTQEVAAATTAWNAVQAALQRAEL